MGVRLLRQAAAPSSLLEPRPRRRGYLSPRRLREAAARSSSSPLGELGRDAEESGEHPEGLRGSSPSELAEDGGLGRAALLLLLPPRARATLLMPAAGT